MKLFEMVKASVSVPQAAQAYGLQTTRTGMALCPFHKDRHPSLKLNQDYFYCFGCGATGDVVDLVSRLFGLDSYDAARKLARDFGLDPDNPPAALEPQQPDRVAVRLYQQCEQHCWWVIQDYLHVLKGWKEHLAPASPHESLDDRFVEACQMVDYVAYLADVLESGAPEQRERMVDMLTDDGLITRLEQRLERLREEDNCHEQAPYPEDIPTFQEFIGYCLIPSNKGQRMMVIKGRGGEGKSQIGAVLGSVFGANLKDGSIGKISENRFARADLEYVLLCVDDDMRMEALRHTNYVKSIVTAQGKMDLERKGVQSYQGWMHARLLAFSNGDLQALFDRSDGFYRRQLVLTTRDRPAGRVDDPDLAEKIKGEKEGIFLWAFQGLQRLAANQFQFTESQRIRDNRETVKRDNNNLFDFMESEGYIRLKADYPISSKGLYDVYRMWCEENGMSPLKPRSFSDAVIANQQKYNLEYTNNITNAAGRRVRGFLGIQPLVHPHIAVFSGDLSRTCVPEG